jgi:hypothetical protein
MTEALCGHFYYYWVKLWHSGGLTEAKFCASCRRYVAFKGAPAPTEER